MKQTIDGTFVMRGYHGLTEHNTEIALSEILRYSFPDGAVVTLELKIQQIDTWPKCTESNKYGVCATVLNKDGTCSNKRQHVSITEDEEEDN